MTLDWDLQEAVWEEFELLGDADDVPVGENRVETELVQNYHGRGRARNFTFESDEPASMAGGGDEGPRPLEYFLAGFAFCQQVLLAKHALATGVELDDVNVEVEGDVDPRGVLGVGDVDSGFDGALQQVTRIESPATEREVRSLVETAEAHCPAHASLAVPVERELYLNGERVD
ncbi:OsmC family protein [Halobacterium rubrum]|uniref:OsmC family protein n=1 Tax=Halobacterium TaxID=2239 RepID=UPI001F402B93|nr:MULTISPECIES: OsmC family protein [Halobacterium]MDH5019919.1 OsmC family protein [Halobacterium rubrum]